MVEKDVDKAITTPTHFKGKEAIAHVIEAHVDGKISASEIHGTEIPGHISAGGDAARETALIFFIFWMILTQLQQSQSQIILILSIFFVGWFLWKTGRSAWLGWSRLERLHRVLEQERWEIEHHRPQEREELKALYAAKGFEGKLLEDVVDVLMADEDRLLRVMIEEELGLSLETHEHPLKQSVGAAIGTFLATIIIFLGLLLLPSFGIPIASLMIVSLSSAISATYQQNRLIPAIVWNVGLVILSAGSVFFLLKYYTQD